MSLKIDWIFREDQEIIEKLMVFIPEALGIKFWECSLQPEHVDMFLNGATPQFWIEVIKMWFGFTWKAGLVNVDTDEQVISQIIWCNSHIRVSEKPFLDKNIASRGIVYVYDLYNETNSLLPWDHFKSMYEMSWWTYKTIISAIPRRWKNLIKTDNKVLTIQDSIYDKVARAPKCTKFVYNWLVDLDTGPTDQIFNKFVGTTWLNIDKEGYIKAHKNIHIVTNVTKYRDFQYRLLVCALPANNQLFHWKKVPSQDCEFCAQPKQDICHIMFFCLQTQRLWDKLLTFINSFMFDVQVQPFTLEKVLLNEVHPYAGHICNFMVLIIKQLLYANKCKQKRTSFRQALHRLNEVYLLEKYNARISCRMTKHSKKWQPYTGEYQIETPNSNINIEAVAREYIENIVPD